MAQILFSNHFEKTASTQTETFTASQSIQAVQAQERLPVHEVESQATADPSVLNLQDNPREASVHPQCTRLLWGRPWPRASLWPMWCCKATNPHLFLWRLSYAMVQIKTLAPNTQGPSLSQIHPRGEFSAFPFSCREGQAWEGQVLLLLTRLNTLKKVKVQPLGFKKKTQQWLHLQ